MREPKRTPNSERENRNRKPSERENTKCGTQVPDKKPAERENTKWGTRVPRKEDQRNARRSGRTINLAKRVRLRALLLRRSMQQWLTSLIVRFLFQPIGCLLLFSVVVSQCETTGRRDGQEDRRSAGTMSECTCCTHSGFHAPTTKKLRNQYILPCAVLAFCGGDESSS
jgi:hypothetical protein